MPLKIGVLAQVPAEAQCLATTIPSLRRLGDVVVLSADAGDEVATRADELGVPVVMLPWNWHYGELLTTAARQLGEGPWLITYADETVAQEGTGDWHGASGPVAVGVRHRTGEQDAYTEENECRAVGAGVAPPAFSGLVYAQVLRGQTTAEPDHLPHTGIVVEHYPSRWQDLSPQRLARTARVYHTALEQTPGDPELLYGLLHAEYSAHTWQQVRELAPVWRHSATAEDPNHPLVDYYEACAAIAERDTRDAVRLAQSAVDRAPRFADGWYLLGELRAASGDLESSDAAFAAAADIGTDADPVAVEDHSLATWRPWKARAVLAKRRGHPQQAEEFLERARRSRSVLRGGS